MADSDLKKSGHGIVAKFFGKKNSMQGLKELMAEVKELDQEGLDQLATGIRNETLTY